MAPKKPPSSSSSLRRRRASFSSISRRQIGIDRHLLAGHGVQVEARGDLGDAAGALGDDDEVHDHQDGEDDDADDEIAAHDEIAERLDDVAGGGGAFVAVRQDQARGGQVERQPQHGRDQQHGREGGEFERRVDEQRRHQDQHREDDRDGQRAVEQQRRQRQDQHHQDGDHADGERDVAALQEGADVAEAGQLDAAVAVVAPGRRWCRSCLDVVSRPAARKKGASSPSRDGAWRAAARITGRDGR